MVRNKYVSINYEVIDLSQDDVTVQDKKFASVFYMHNVISRYCSITCKHMRRKKKRILNNNFLSLLCNTTSYSNLLI